MHKQNDFLILINDPERMAEVYKETTKISFKWN